MDNRLFCLFNKYFALNPMKNLITLFSLLLFTFTAGAQANFNLANPSLTSTFIDDSSQCGFIATQNQLNTLEDNREYQESKNKFIANYNLRALTPIDWVPIKAHITRTDAGTGGLAINELNDAINDMNLFYINANMQFYLCDGINYIDDDDYYNFNASDESAMHTAHGQTNLINIYFCNTVTSSGGSSLCGYAYYPGGPDVILMKNSCAVNGSTLAHEMGHFYSCRHTHGGSNGTLTSELVNGSNCSTDGDYVCDTPADPQLGNSNVNTSCVYDGSAPYTSGGGVDANGQQFVPNPNNVMSYSRKTCRNFFSVGQYARINSAHSTVRNYFTCPTFDVDYTATPTSACSLPATVNFTDNSTGATNWQWDVDGDNIVDYTSQNPSHVYSVAGTYDVRLTISDGTTSISKTEISFITVGDFASAPTTDMQTACNSYTWPENGLTYPSSTNTPSVTLTNAVGCDSVINLDLTINNVSDVSTSIAGFTIEANNSSASYAWLDCDNNYAVIPGETNQSYTPSDEGNYAVQLTENGCIDTSACTSNSSTGIIQSNFGKGLVVYPNPSKGNFSIDLGNSYETVAISISDINGRIISSKDYTQEQFINLTIDEAIGLYFLTIHSRDKKAVIQLIKN